MISLIGNTIKIPQGENGSVSIFFKDIKNDYPLILPKLNESYKEEEKYTSFIRFIVRKSPDNSSDLVFTKDFILPDRTIYGQNRDNEDDKTFRRFDSAEYLEASNVSEIVKTERLYAINETVNGLSFWYKNSSNNLYEYDFINSSIPIVFERNDTYNLRAQQYYYELTYIEGICKENGEIDQKVSQTLQNPTPFIVTGALN